MALSNKLLIYGGRGALGKELVDFFRSKNIVRISLKIKKIYFFKWVLNVDMSESEAANSNVLVDPLQSWVEQEKNVLNGWGIFFWFLKFLTF